MRLSNRFIPTVVANNLIKYAYDDEAYDDIIDNITYYDDTQIDEAADNIADALISNIDKPYLVDYIKALINYVVVLHDIALIGNVAKSETNSIKTLKQLEDFVSSRAYPSDPESSQAYCRFDSADLNEARENYISAKRALSEVAY